MSTAAQIILVVITAMIFLVRFAVALYHTQADHHAAETYRRRHDTTATPRGRPAE